MLSQFLYILQTFNEMCTLIYEGMYIIGNVAKTHSKIMLTYFELKTLKTKIR